MYTIGSIKTFRGMEGHGLNAKILKDGKAIAFVLDEGCGGEVQFDFLNPDQNAKSFEKNKDFAAQREKEFGEFALKWYVDSGRHAADEAQSAEWDREAGREFVPCAPNANTAMEYWVNHIVDEQQMKKRLDSLAKKKTLFRLKDEQYNDGEYLTLTQPYSAAIQGYLDRKYGDRVAMIYGVNG